MSALCSILLCYALNCIFCIAVIQLAVILLNHSFDYTTVDHSIGRVILNHSIGSFIMSVSMASLYNDPTIHSTLGLLFAPPPGDCELRGDDKTRVASFKFQISRIPNSTTTSSRYGEILH
jgi:hypothetical protein